MTQHECPDCLWGVGREPLDLESIALHLAKISPGPWRLEYDHSDEEMKPDVRWPDRFHGPKSVNGRAYEINEVIDLQEADAEFMVHGPEYVRYLLDVIAHLESQTNS